MKVCHQKDLDGNYYHKCKSCGDIFPTKYAQKVYCSDACKKYVINLRAKQKNAENKNSLPDSLPTQKDIHFTGGSGFDMYPEATHGERVSFGKQEKKKILNCSVDCLIKELGDIE